MKVRRIVANIETADPAAVARFYEEVLGLTSLMDHGWIATYGSEGTMPLQVKSLPPRSRYGRIRQAIAAASRGSANSLSANLSI